MIISVINDDRGVYIDHPEELSHLGGGSIDASMAPVRQPDVSAVFGTPCTVVNMDTAAVYVEDIIRMGFTVTAAHSVIDRLVLDMDYHGRGRPARGGSAGNDVCL